MAATDLGTLIGNMPMPWRRWTPVWPNLNELRQVEKQ